MLLLAAAFPGLREWAWKRAAAKVLQECGGWFEQALSSLPTNCFSEKGFSGRLTVQASDSDACPEDRLLDSDDRLEDNCDDLA